jgi:hypothetical protein
MTPGHRLTALGALLLALGAAALPWQRFVLTDLTVPGWAVPSAGQPLIALAALLLAAAVAGLASRPRKAAAMVTLGGGLAALVLVIAADLSRGDVFALPPEEIVEMLGGHTLALVGALTALVGSLMALAADPAAEPDAPLLRVALVWRGAPMAERVVTAGRSLTLGEAPGNDLVIAGPGIPQAMTLIAPRRGGFWLNAPAAATGHACLGGATVTVAGRQGPPAARALAPGDWGALELGEATVAFEVERPERRRKQVGRPRFNDVVAAAVAVSALIQGAFVVWAALSWQEEAAREVVHNERRQPQAEAVVRPARTLRGEARPAARDE